MLRDVNWNLHSRKRVYSNHVCTESWPIQVEAITRMIDSDHDAPISTTRWSRDRYRNSRNDSSICSCRESPQSNSAVRSRCSAVTTIVAVAAAAATTRRRYRRTSTPEPHNNAQDTEESTESSNERRASRKGDKTTSS